MLKSTELHQVVERVLRLLRFELDEIEQRMLDVLQRREWFTPRQLDYLESIEKFYPQNDSSKYSERDVQQPFET